MDVSQGSCIPSSNLDSMKGSKNRKIITKLQKVGHRQGDPYWGMGRKDSLGGECPLDLVVVLVSWPKHCLGFFPVVKEVKKQNLVRESEFISRFPNWGKKDFIPSPMESVIAFQPAHRKSWDKGQRLCRLSCEAAEEPSKKVTGPGLPLSLSSEWRGTSISLVRI